MNQSKLESIIEQIVNVSSGMFIAYFTMQLFLAPMLGIHISPHENIIVTLVLTVVSVLRGYMWRRFFNRKLYKEWAIWIKSRLDNHTN